MPHVSRDGITEDFPCSDVGGPAFVRIVAESVNVTSVASSGSIRDGLEHPSYARSSGDHRSLPCTRCSQLSIKVANYARGHEADRLRYSTTTKVPTRSGIEDEVLPRRRRDVTRWRRIGNRESAVIHDAAYSHLQATCAPGSMTTSLRHFSGWSATKCLVAKDAHRVRAFGRASFPSRFVSWNC